MSNTDLSKGPLHDDPFTWFGEWLAEAEATGMTDPNACTVATVGHDDQPSARAPARTYGIVGCYCGS